MMESTITIVVPVYNVPFKYLDHCINSIIQQTYKKIEIIIVDDGSKEEWAVKCDSYCALDNRIQVVHKQNGGLSDARNRGLAESKSEWITFVDGDDWIEKTFIELFVNKISAEIDQSDVYYFSAYRNYPNMEVKGVPYFEDGKKFSTYEEREDLQTRCFTNHLIKTGNVKGITISSAWAKVYRTRFLKDNNLLFPIVPYDEDSLFYLETIEKASSIVYYVDPIYHYRYTEGSIVNRYRPNAVREQEIYLVYIFEFASRNCKSREFIDLIYMRVFTSMLLLIKQFYYHPENKDCQSNRHKQCNELFKLEPYAGAMKKVQLKKLRRNPQIKFLLVKMHLYGAVEGGRRINHKSIVSYT